MNKNQTQIPPNTYDDKFLNISSIKFKRSVRQYKRRESIKIVPGGYIHKRSIPDQNNNQTDEFMQKCCERHQCICDTLCFQPECLPDQVLLVEEEATFLPGNCCPTYKCHPARSNQQETTCYSTTKKEHFFTGEIWMEDACTQCECDHGQSNCRSSSCKPIHCEKKIENPGECCPVCDLSNSKYCTGQEDCDIVCRNGYDIDVTGCTICRCAKSSTTYPIDDHGTDVQTVPTDVSIDNIDLTPTFEDFVYNNHIIYIALLAIILVIATLSLWKYLQNKKNNRTYNIVPSV